MSQGQCARGGVSVVGEDAATSTRAGQCVADVGDRIVGRALAGRQDEDARRERAADREPVAGGEGRPGQGDVERGAVDGPVQSDLCFHDADPVLQTQPPGSGAQKRDTLVQRLDERERKIGAQERQRNRRRPRTAADVDDPRALDRKSVV